MRKLRNEHLVVAIGEASKEFHGMIRMNEVGAWIWNQMQQNISREELIGQMISQFPELDPQQAAEDLEDFLTDIQVAVEE